MRLLRKYNQYRRDCTIDAQCENCSETKEGIEAYDDDNYWVNVLSDMKCESCGETTKSLGIQQEVIVTKYPEGFQV